jgi:uncharacterized protein YwgA
MNTFTPETRVAILARMVKKAPGQALGRTQVMKLFYFLQELKGVPLEYDFRLFNYGPFDSEVLSDLSSACGLETVVEKTIIYPSGYRYAITPGPQADRLDGELDHTLTSVVDQTVREFGAFSASELELRSTILFVDREFAGAGQNTSADEIIERVRQIKPHFESHVIRERVLDMANKGYLQNVSSRASSCGSSAIDGGSRPI